MSEDVYTVHQNVDGKFYCKCNAHPLKVGDKTFETLYFDTETEAENMINYFRALKSSQETNLHSLCQAAIMNREKV